MKTKNTALFDSGTFLDTPMVALYARVSTTYQVDKDSLPHQKKELKNYCKHILHIPDERIMIFEDAGKSAKNTKRPAFERMMKLVRAGRVSHVLVYKIDRISRNLVDFSLMYDDFKKHRVTFISMNEQFDTSSAIGEAILKIILVFSELERKMTSERVTDIMLGRAKNGLWNGANVPFGYSWDESTQSPIPHPVESSVVKQMYNYYEKEHSSCMLRNYLNANDMPTKRGGEWTSKTVADIIRNPIYKGTYRYNYRESARGKIKPESEWILLDDAFTPLIGKDQWKRCNDIMDHNAAFRNNMCSQSKKKHTHVFGGLLRCGACGSNMISDKDRLRKNGFFPSGYRCGNRWRKNTCMEKGITDVVLGPFIFNYIKNIVQATNEATFLDTPNELERLLLTGSCFSGIAGIESNSLNLIFSTLKGLGRESVAYNPAALSNLSNALSASTPVTCDATKSIILKEEKVKNIRALERLKKLYLFDEFGMDEKEYLETKQKLEVRNVQIDNELKEYESTDSSMASSEFILSASSFLIAHKLTKKDYIDYKEFAPIVGDEVLKDFVNTVIKNIIIINGKVDTIIFKNGMEHKFIWKC